MEDGWWEGWKVGWLDGMMDDGQEVRSQASHVIPARLLLARCRDCYGIAAAGWWDGGMVVSYVAKGD